MSADTARIANTLGKMGHYLNNHNCICVGVSGGSDSNIIVHMIATYFREYLPKVHFVFINTGLEYQATKRHIKYMEGRYNINIEIIKGKSIVTVVRQCGFPIVSKEFSGVVNRALNGSKTALEKINGEMLTKDGKLSAFNFSPKQKRLALHIVENNIKVSDKCCLYSKKQPVHKYYNQVGCDLAITGERRSEGGQRATSHSSCFEKREGRDKYMPLFFWDDDTKQYYKESEGIVYSDCYEVWGMYRTGCVGCPFNSRAGFELKLIQKYEPNLYKACMNIFGESYRLMDEFNIHREPIFDEVRDNQLTIFDTEDIGE